MREDSGTLLIYIQRFLIFNLNLGQPEVHVLLNRLYSKIIHKKNYEKI